jgi:hypothetical protein
MLAFPRLASWVAEESLIESLTHTIIAMIAMTLSMVSCGGGQTAPPPGSQGILNGQTHATASSHWVSTNCGVSVELTSDGNAFSVVHDTLGNVTSASGTWTAGPSAGSITVNAGNALGFSISSLTSIQGTTTSGVFSADVTVVDRSGTSQDLHTCSFSLLTGPLS